MPLKGIKFFQHVYHPDFTVADEGYTININKSKNWQSMILKKVFKHQ